MWQRISRKGLDLLKLSGRTTHTRIVTAGLAIGLLYLPVWLQEIVIAGLRGSTAILLLAIVYLGLNELWKDRRALAAAIASEEDQLLGHALIIVSILLFPICRFAVWSQALLWATILAGIACSSWGIHFFRKYAVVTVLCILSVYPKPGVTGQILWETFTPPHLLENFMAWAGGLALQAIGQPATVDTRFIVLPSGAVEVGWGCNGFSMALNMAAASLILGLFLKQRWFKVVGMMLIGAGLALVFNIPRIMLLSFAAIYWGKAAFAFWHGPWGGQLFSGVLFTVYYYVIMGSVGSRPAKARN